MGKKTKVVYIIPAEGFGGAERQAIFHIRNLPEYGIEVVTITGPGRKIVDNLKDVPTHVYYCPFFPGEYGKPFSFFPFCYHLIKTAAAWLRSVFFVASIVKKEHADLIFAARVGGWALAAPVSLTYGIPSVWRFGSRVKSGTSRAALGIMTRIFKPIAIMSNCNAVLDSVKGVIGSPVFIVPNGIDSSHIKRNADLKLRNRHTPGTIIVGLAARPSPDKGMDFFSDVVSIVAESSAKICFYIAGEFGWRASIQKKFEDKGLGNKVTFLGHVDDMASFYLSCDIVVLTSRKRSIEGFPNALLEAMSLERPVIATVVGGIPELVEHEKTGILVKSGDSVGFACEIIKLAADADKRRMIGTAAGKMVAGRYNRDKTVGLLAENMFSILAGKKNAVTGLVGAAGVKSGLMNAFRSAAVLIILFIGAVFAADDVHGGVPGNFNNVNVNQTAAKRPGSNEMKIDLSQFVPISKTSKDANYYTLKAEPGIGNILYAHYVSPMKAVKLGYEFPKDMRLKKVSWRWRVLKHPAGSNEREKGKDDSGAGVYLVFGNKFHKYIIKYVYSIALPAGMYFKKESPLQKMWIVVASSYLNTKNDGWIPVSVDVQSEYKRLYGAEDCPPLSGVGLMTDGDETKSEVIAEYDSFVITYDKN